MKFKLINRDVFHEYDLLLVSAGGSGCTTIHKLLDGKVRKNHTDDVDYLKHLSSPEQNIYLMNRFKSVIYIYNDPLLSIISHYRRGWAQMQHKKIANASDLVLDKINTIEKLQENTLKLKKEIFGIQQHFLNWVNLSDKRSNVAIVDFRDVNDTISVIESLFEKKINYNIVERSPKTKNILNGLDKKMVEFYSELDKSNVDKIDKLKLTRNLTRVS